MLAGFDGMSDCFAAGNVKGSTRRCYPMRALLVFLSLLPVSGQFGGGGGYNPPAPVCPPFACSDGELPVGKPDHQIWSYGCKESGMNMFSASSFDPKNPLGNMQQHNLNKCCVERDICKQTCGMTSKLCHDSFQKCSKKICKGDQNCDLQAMISDIMADPHDDSIDAGKKYDPDEAKCRQYIRGQAEACMCAPKAGFRGVVESKLKHFYSRYNSERIDKSGNVKDIDDVWKKWEGKEAEMFLALATKYKEKAVEIREKPKRDYKREPEASQQRGDDASWSTGPETLDDEDGDPEAASFSKERAVLEKKKQQAKTKEDYDAAEIANDELAQLIQNEIARLSTLKAEAVAQERYKDAKRLKSRLKSLEEL